MCEMVSVFDARLTNHRKAKKTNKKTAKMRFYLFWQDILCNSRANEMHDLLRFGKETELFLQIL